MLGGTMWVTKSTKRMRSPDAVNAETSPPEREPASSPTPGRTRLTTTSPMASAKVVTISK
jgi:hypothetical protein